MINLKFLTISSGEFKRIYYTMTYREMQEAYGWTTNQISTMAKRLGVVKNKGRRKTKFIFNDEEVQ